MTDDVDYAIDDASSVASVVLQTLYAMIAREDDLIMTIKVTSDPDGQRDVVMEVNIAT